MFRNVVAMMLASTLFVQASSDIEIKGSTTVLLVVKKVAEGFTRETGLTVTVAGGGSSKGIAYVMEGGPLGMASRELKDKERKAGVVGHLIGQDGIAVIVHPENPITDLSRDQLARIFSGEVESWTDFGWQGAIHRYGASSEHGTNQVFKKLLGIGKTFKQEGFGSFDEATDILDAVHRDPLGIAFVSIGQYYSWVIRLNKYKARSVRVDNVKASFQTVQEQVYPLSRPLLLVTMGNPKEDVQKFIDYIQSPKSQKLIQQFSFVPLN